MKLTKGFWLRILPVFVVVIITVVLSVNVYYRMIEIEKESCWERLEIATKSTAEKIRVRLNDNLNFLETVSDSFVLTSKLEEEELVGNYLTSVMENTIFERIDVIFPDGSILTQTGEVVSVDGKMSYEELLSKGSHISHRYISPFTGKEVIYCVTAIELNGNVQALLCGTIDCETMGQIFEVFTYKKESQLFLIDCADGNYLMDNWHKELGNIYDMGLRQSIDGDEMIDMVPSIINREESRIAYVSQTNGVNSYQYNVPVEDFNWELCVVVQEDVVFEHVNELRDILFSVGVIETVLVLVYVVWNIVIAVMAVKNENRNKKLEMERAANKARAKFISNMSHDVRTPLNGIVGMLDIIKKHRNDDKLVDDCLRKIEISTNYLSTLTNDMLDINEIESNKLLLVSEFIDLREMSEEISVMVEQKVEERQIDYSIDCSNLKNPCIMGSTVHIKRILMNLISNAIKYSKGPGGQVYVLIEDRPISQERGIYRFIVKDNGIGMTEEFQKNMYNAFEQEQVTARSSYQGYGLGLTIVNHLVKRMDGSIELESTKDVGSTFTVILPLKIAQKDNVPKVVEEELVSLSGFNILLVEDNEINMEIAEMLLTDAGASVTTAVNGKIATEIFARSEINSFSLILMDIMMPEMDGFEATGVIRSMDRPDSRTIPIIAMTASAFTEEINRSKEVGMNEHIAKPLDIDKLMLKVMKYCKKSSY